MEIKMVVTGSSIEAVISTSLHRYKEHINFFSVNVFYNCYLVYYLYHLKHSCSQHQIINIVEIVEYATSTLFTIFYLN